MPDSKNRERLLQEIAGREARLAALRLEQAEVELGIESLRHQLIEIDSHPDPCGSIEQPEDRKATATAAGRIALFRSLFRGRDDVYATRFLSARTGRSGYAPACRNKWVKGVCELPRIKCGECSNQAFLSPDEDAIRSHLMGQHTVGVYPLLPDETCLFLAIDFDRSSWREDVAAIRETCRRNGLEPAVERSRSGEGAHVWFFFSTPISARTARAMGCILITETMSRRPDLGMDSYDRLFPNQDTMPRGGFGNLIAAPLQGEARKEGNSVFVNDDLEVIPDQWQFLASVQRLKPQSVNDLVMAGAGAGGVLGVRSAGDDDEEMPLTLQEEIRRPDSELLTGPLPSEVHVVLAERLFVEKTNLPPALINQIRRLAAFQNPEFYRKQRFRLSTALTPRVISCAEEHPHFVSLPRGCLESLESLLLSLNIPVVVKDERSVGQRTDLQFKGQLTPNQQEAAEALLAHDLGLLVAPPGSGKTVIGTYITARRNCGTLVLVHRQPLLDQWVARLALFLGIDEREIGRIGGGKRRPNGHLDVAMLQSLLRSGEDGLPIGGYGQVIVDECHHVPAVSFEKVLNAAKARYLVGLTATLQRRDGHHPIIEMQLGPVRHRITLADSEGSRQHEYGFIVRETPFRLSAGGSELRIQELYGALAKDKYRNDLILDDVLAAVEQGRSPLVLSERREHLEWLAERLKPAVRNLVVLTGGATVKNRREAIERLAKIPEKEERLVLATGRYVGEGFDDARLDTLFLALPVSWKGTVVQYAGRLHRDHPGKSRVLIVDYVDRIVPMLARMHEKRLRTYRAMGYAPQAWPFSNPGHHEVTIERLDSEVW